MSDARLLAPGERDVGLRHGRDAIELARRLPDICVSAREVAGSVMHGVHGRRRAGIGEAFWQFRPFAPGESASRIDWRRSARDDRTYIREREWEAAQTVWLWIDRSPSMAFVSRLAQQSKLDRALVLGLAAADLLVRGGERVGLLGLTRPIASRTVVDRLAEALVLASSHADDELPRPAPLPSRSRARADRRLAVRRGVRSPRRCKAWRPRARAGIWSRSPIRSRRAFPSRAMSNSPTSTAPPACGSARPGPCATPI